MSDIDANNKTNFQIKLITLMSEEAEKQNIHSYQSFIREIANVVCELLVPEKLILEILRTKNYCTSNRYCYPEDYLEAIIKQCNKTLKGLEKTKEEADNS